MNNLFRISEKEEFDKGEIFFLHNNKETLSSAYEIQEKASIKLKIPRAISVTSAKLQFLIDSDKNRLSPIDFVWSDIEFGYDVYQAILPLRNLGRGIYFLSICLQTICGEMFAEKKNGILCFSKIKPRASLQLTVSDFKYLPPNAQYGGIIYHIFIDRFYRGKNTPAKDGAHLVDNWYAPIPEYPEFPGAPLKNNYFYGGDLWGVADKLDYIKSLGVTILYLSPIFESPSNHKYDTADYMHVDKMFGGDGALINLIKKAKKKGISIILDGVFNHTGDDSVYFNKYGKYSEIGAYQSKKSRYYPWYNFHSFPNEYSAWWGIEILPKINTDLSECKSFFAGENGVIDKYAKMGILGFRLDVADELSDTFISSIKESLNERNSTSILYGEVWEDASNKIAYGKLKNYYLGNELDGVMNYPLRDGIISFLRDFETEKLLYALTEVTFNAPKRIRDAQMNILGTHDTERIITVLGGESSTGKSNDYLSTLKMNEQEYEKGRRRLLMGATALFTLPGIPCIFYGDEAGLEGYKDPFNRRTFPWNNIDSIIIAHYRKLAKIRIENKVYRDGDFKLIYLCNGILVFERIDKYNSYITVLNNTEKELTVRLSRVSESLFDMKKSDTFKIESETSSVIKANRNIQFEI